MNKEEVKCLNDCGFANVTQLLLAYVGLQQKNKQLKEEINNIKNHYRNIVDNQLAECLEPDCEDFYLADIEAKANTLEELKKWLEECLKEKNKIRLEDNNSYEAGVIDTYENVLDKIKELEEGVK